MPAAHSFEAFPPLETYQDLTKAYLERGLGRSMTRGEGSATPHPTGR